MSDYADPGRTPEEVLYDAIQFVQEALDAKKEELGLE